MTDADRIKLVLHEEQHEYSIGEPIRPRLQIVNPGGQAIEIRGFRFDWERLEFAEPNAVHLIAPGGVDLARPYRQEPGDFKGSSLIKINAGAEEWLFLPIYVFFHLRQPGDYTFWLELTDHLGGQHKSNSLHYSLVDVEFSRSPSQFDLTIQPREATIAASEEPELEIEVTFTNHSDQPLVILKPQEESLYGWANPVYQFTVVDPQGRTLPMHPRSGTMAPPEYNGMTQFAIAPSGSQQLRLNLPPFSEMQNPGVYHVRLTYLVRNQGIGKAGTVLEQQMNWGRDVFVGRLESNEIILTIV